MKNKSIFLTTLTATLFASRLTACDFCVCDLPSLAIDSGKGLRFRVSEQITHFGTLQQDNHTIPNPAGEYLSSSVTQIIIGFDFSRALGVQFPVVRENSGVQIVPDWRMTASVGLRF